MAGEVIAPNATNPDAREGVDPSLDPNQVTATGNPQPKEPKAKAPKEPEKKPEQKDAKTEETKGKEPDPKEEPAKEEKPDLDKPLDTSVWGDGGSENANAVLQLLQNSGVTTEEAQALMYDGMVAGDVTKIDRAKLEAKVGKAAATIILQGAQNVINERRAAANAIVDGIHKQVGGKGNWEKVAAWANKNIPEGDLNEYRGMIDAGGVQSKLAAQQLKALYEKADGNSSLQIEEVLPGGNPPTPTSEPLTAAQYVRKLEELNAKFHGNPPAHLRQALLDGRKRGRQLGR